MNDFEQIDDYFSGRMSVPDKVLFEKRCVADADFSKEVSLYVVSRQQVHHTLVTEKREQFRQQFNELSKSDSNHRSVQVNWFRYFAVAASIAVILVAYFTLIVPKSPSSLALNYVEQNLETLPVTMGASQDKLQTGIEAYNNKDYQTASRIFSELTKDQEVSAEATKLLGLTYLVQQEYDEAIIQFKSLAADEKLYTNPGKFYQAVSLLCRSRDGDRAEAKILLQEIVDKKLYGYKEASDWLAEL